MTAPLPPKTKSASEFARELNNISDKRRLWGGDISKRDIQIAKAALTRAIKDIKEYRETMVDTVGRMALNFEMIRLGSMRDKLKDIDDL